MGERIACIEIDDRFGNIINCAVRYALGRQTYAVGEVTDYVTRIIKDLNDRTLLVIKNDLEGCTHFGNEHIDKPEWMKLLREVNGELERRNKTYK